MDVGNGLAGKAMDMALYDFTKFMEVNLFTLTDCRMFYIMVQFPRKCQFATSVIITNA